MERQRRRGGILIDAATGDLLGSPFSAFGAGCPGIAGTPTLSTLTAPTLAAIHILRIDHLDPANVAIVTTGLSNTTSSLGPLPADLQPFGLATGCANRASPLRPPIRASHTTTRPAARPG